MYLSMSSTIHGGMSASANQIGGSMGWLPCKRRFSSNQFWILSREEYDANSRDGHSHAKMFGRTNLVTLKMDSILAAWISCRHCTKRVSFPCRDSAMRAKESSSEPMFYDEQKTHIPGTR